LIAKPVAGVIGGLVLLIVLVFTALSLIYSPTYMVRLILWQEADVDDSARFPKREIPAAPEPFKFGSPADVAGAAERVRMAIGASPLTGGDLANFLETTETQAFVVIQDGEILEERYLGGFERDSVATSFSVAKSYVSALVGIAIEEGAIGGADDPITTYLPELLKRDGRFGEITIRNLLDMT
jgi:CubicO group peptidase (beta-lactamase class C family)